MRLQGIHILITILVFTGCEQKTSQEVISITKSELMAAWSDGDIQLLDVRRPEEFNQGHIKGAMNANVLDSLAFYKGISALNKEKPIYIYCQAGKRSKKASEKLKDLGFTTIYDYSDGYGAWANDN